MYICICNAVTDSAIRDAVEDGARSLRELSFRTGCSTQCGRCVGRAREVMNEALADIGEAPAPVDLLIVNSS
jgi:bacterioferritin-associated ferredoxin